VNLLRNPVLKVVGILALAIVLVAGCTKKPSKPSTDIPPITRITTYGIATVPDSAAFYNVTVYWGASDPDGQAEKFRYWVDQADLPDSLKTETYETNITMRMQFNSAITSHDFYVQSRDNRNVWDPNAATMAIVLGNVSDVTKFSPSTLPVTVPPDGALTSRGVHFIIDGSDLDGSVVNFQRAIDDTTNWVTVAPTFVLSHISTLELNLTPTDISLGPHVLYVRAIDNFGNVDKAPLTVSFVAVDTLRPDLSVVAGAIPHAFYFLPSGGTTTDVATTWSADASWYFSTLQFRYAVDDTANWSAPITESSVNLTGLTAGAHHFFIQAIDQAGNASTFSTDFGVGQLTGERGILVVNGLDWATYGAQTIAMYTDNAPFGSHSIHFWDMFTGASSNYPPNIASVFVGSGAIPGDSLGHYSSVVMLVNEFAANGPTDLDIFNSMRPLIMSYLNGGGNVLLAGRFGADFIKGDLASYGLSSGHTLSFNQTGVNPAPGGLAAAVTGLVDIHRLAGQSWSLTDLLEPPTDPAVTILFTTPDYSSSVGGIMVEPTGTGKFGFIAGRPYRMDHTAMATDYGYILTHYFGEQ
jgi:hypothetical protein